jgi:hypothetical protein
MSLSLRNGDEALCVADSAGNKLRLGRVDIGNPDGNTVSRPSERASEG